MTIPASSTVPGTTSKYAADVEVTSLLTAVRALLGIFTSDILAVANGGTGLSAKKSAQAHLTAATSCVNNTASIINYDTVDEDTDSAITTGAGWKFTCKKAGQYQLSASAGIGNPLGGGAAYITVFVNSAESKRGTRSNFVVNEAVTALVACDLQLALNDTVDIRFLQTSGGNVNTETGAVVNHFSIHLIPGT